MSLDIISAEANPATRSLRRDDAEAVSKSEAAREKLADEFDEFMLLLTTQLQNQDPTEPLDTNQFTQQLVQFTGVEQSVETNNLLEELISLNSSSQTDSAVSYIGRYVETDGNEGILRDGAARFAYDLPEGTQTATLTIMDSKGKPVHTQTVQGEEGSFTYNWDGINSFDSTQMPDGVYQFGLVARDINNQTLDATTYTSGLVTSVSLNGEQPVMKLDGQLEVPANKINSVIGYLDQ